MIKRISDHYSSKFAAAADAHVRLDVYGVQPNVLRNTHVSTQLRARQGNKDFDFQPNHLQRKRILVIQTVLCG